MILCSTTISQIGYISYLDCHVLQLNYPYNDFIMTSRNQKLSIYILHHHCEICPSIHPSTLCTHLSYSGLQGPESIPEATSTLRSPSLKKKNPQSKMNQLAQLNASEIQVERFPLSRPDMQMIMWKPKCCADIMNILVCPT